MIVKSLKLGEASSTSGMIYPVEEMREAIGRYKKTVIPNKCAFGQFVMGSSYHTEGSIGSINLSETSHLILDVGIDSDNYLWAEIKFLDTMLGRLAQNALQDNIAWSPRGVGTVDEKTKTISGYELLGIDCILKLEIVEQEPPTIPVIEPVSFWKRLIGWK